MKKGTVLLVLGCVLAGGLLAQGVTMLTLAMHQDKINDIKTLAYEAAEAAYFSGQYEALTGDVRIGKKDGKWIWLKSPWDNGRLPMYDPNK